MGDEDARSIRAGFVAGRTAADIVEDHLARIDALEPAVHALLLRTEDHARGRAAELDRRTAAAGALAGVPIVLKDAFVTRGIATTANSRILAGWIPPFDGTHAARLAEAGAILLGKAAMDEFAMGSSSENVPGEPVRNPWAIDRVAGGSSGGTAAAVAAGMVPLGLGTDTGGSIRQPAAMCGVVGLKPSYGRVTRFGMIAFASSLDHAGTIARNVRDAALGLSVIAGHDPRDATSIAAPVGDLLGACERAPTGMRVGVHRRALELPGLDPEVRTAFVAALEVLRDRGLTLVDIELPHFELAIATYYVICAAEAASNLARYDGVRYGQRVPAEDLAQTIEASRSAGFGAEVKRRILLGTFVLRKDGYDAYYGRAQRVRTAIARDYDQAFASCDVIASPTSPVPAFRLGERASDPLAMYLSDVFTVGANLAGLPAISIPAGFTAAGAARPRLPIGLQLVGPHLGEEAVLTVAAAHEAATPWQRERPPLGGVTPGPSGAPP